MSYPPSLPTNLPPPPPPLPATPNISDKKLDTSVPPPNFYSYSTTNAHIPSTAHSYYNTMPPLPSATPPVTSYNYGYPKPPPPASLPPLPPTPPTLPDTTQPPPMPPSDNTAHASPYPQSHYYSGYGYDYTAPAAYHQNHYSGYEQYNYNIDYYGGSTNQNDSHKYKGVGETTHGRTHSRGGYVKPAYSSRSYHNDSTTGSKYERKPTENSGKTESMSNPRYYAARERDRERNREPERVHDRDRERDRNRERERDRERARVRPSKPETERDRLLKNYQSNYCENPEDIAKKLVELLETEEGAPEKWVRSSPADLFYKRSTANPQQMEAKPRLTALCKLFHDELIERAKNVLATLPPYEPPPRKPRRHVCRHKSEACSSSSSDDSSEDEFKIEQDCCMEELSRKLQHPYRIHTDLWHNDPGEMNDGPLCRCSAKSKRIGIRHGIYPGENCYEKCDPSSNNASKLHHYRITISPPTNFLTKTPTIIKHDEHEFIFEGFSLLTHQPLGDLPTCKVIRFNIEYTILYVEETMPENFTIRELDLFTKYLFHELLELVDFSLYPHGPNVNADETCPAFHLLPRFVRDLPDNGKEVLAMSEVLKYLLDSAKPLVDKDLLHCLQDIEQADWQDYVDFIKGMLVTKPGYKPCSVRVDQLDRNASDLPECINEEEGIVHPVIVHFGIRPPQLSYAGNPEYQKAWREYVKFRHLMANMSKPSFKDKRKLEEKEARLQEMRTQGRMKRNITVAVSSKGYYRTGVMCDIVQHAMLIPVLAGHLRFHKSLDLLEQSIGYKFKNRYLLQLALTHPSYKENYGTNPDHARNSLTNCGIRQPEYGDRKIHYMNTRKRGINTLINIMSRFGKEYETMSNITHNERLEFLGDAVVEFLSSIHLFFMFPDLEEGGLATYRAAIVQNQHLALLAKKLHLEEYMLYAHGSDLCHELELRHAMANCFEALMGALLLDGGISVADVVFMNALFMEDEQLRKIWENTPEHPLQEQEPLGDRSCIANYPMLQNLTEFEDSVGIKFKHIRLLARAFTDRSIGFTHLTLGSNQRLEFLGDTVLQLICSEYLYRHFPEHHEGHLSLLRSSLVNNRTQAVVCDDLGMTKYAVYSNPKAELKTKDRADLLEAFLGALYVDKGLLYCEQFCHVCLFPRLQMFIMNQDWNDPKSKLQQCCLTLRTMDGGEPDIPIYKVIESSGPTNTRVYTVAVYFRSKRLATATGSSIQQAEMNAAKQALENSRDLFPQLDHQKRVIAKSIKKQTGVELNLDYDKQKNAGRNGAAIEDESHLPKQYRVREDISSDELPEDEDDDDDNDENAQSDDDSDSEEEATQRKQLPKSPSKAKSSERISSDEESNAKPKQSKRRRCSSKLSSKSSNHSINTNIAHKLCEDVSSDESFEAKSKRKRKSSSSTSLTKQTSKPQQPITAISPQKLCEDVSSDECFDEAAATTTLDAEKSALTIKTERHGTPERAIKAVARTMIKIEPQMEFETQPLTIESATKQLIATLDDLVEDVSSNTDMESGEISE